MNEEPSVLIRNGRLREDLFYRIAGFSLYIPPLRDRAKDIFDLSDFFISEFNVSMDKNILGLSKELKKLISQYNWPGNIRELQNVIEYSINMSQSKVLTLDSMPKSIMNIDYDKKEEGTEEIRTLEELEIREIKKALIKYKDYKKDKELAAKSLGISRATLYRKLEKYKDKINGDTYLK